MMIPHVTHALQDKYMDMCRGASVHNKLIHKAFLYMYDRKSQCINQQDYDIMFITDKYSYCSDNDQNM
jgi:hypothetical protein